MILSRDDESELEELYLQAVKLANKITQENPKLFKTAFQCLFWEGCHYIFQRKLRERK